MKPIKLKRTFITLLLTLVIAVGFAQNVQTETGIASFYNDKFVGRKTANGEIFTQDKMTAAHKTLPLGTWVRVTNLKNDSTIIVKINDRLPQSSKRTIDLTEAGAGNLNFIRSGLTKVLLEIIPEPFLTKNMRPGDLPLEPMQMYSIKPLEDNTRVVKIAPIRDLIDMEVYFANRSMQKKVK